MLALVTRPKDDAEGTATLLRQRGFDVLIEPMMTVVDLAVDLGDLPGVQGLLATSANGVRAMAKATDRRDVPVWAVGDATARMALDHGFTKVESAEGDVQSLAKLVAAKTSPKAGAFLHGAGKEVAGDLMGLLTQAGFSVRREVLYRTDAILQFNEPTRVALEKGALDVALFFSPRTAHIFTQLVKAATIEYGLSATRAVALSKAVGENLSPLPWAEISVSLKPTQESLFRTLDRDDIPSD